MEITRMNTNPRNVGFNIILIMIAIFALIFMGYPVSANTPTSGSISVSNETHANYSNTSWTTLGYSNYENYTRFVFDYTDFNTLTNYTIYDVSHLINYRQQAETTTFTCVTNCTGGGTASYSNYLFQLQWVWTPGSVITGSPIKIAYSHPIFNNLSVPGALGTTSYMYQTLPKIYGINSEPMYVFNDTTGGAGSCSTAVPCALTGTRSSSVVKFFDFGGIFSSGTVTNTYNVTYLQNGFFDMNIGKTGQQIFTNDIVHSQTLTIFSESTFNNNSFEVLGQTQDGLYLNVTMSTGDYNDALINSSGTGIVIPTPTPTPPQIPSGQNAAIAFDASSYNIGATGTLTTNTSFGFFDINSYRVDFYSNSNPLINQFPIDKSQTSQNFVVQFPLEGLYTANIVKTVPIIGDYIIANDTADVIRGTGSLTVPITVATGKNFSVNYTLNYIAQANNMCGLGGTGIFAVYQPDGSIQAQLYLLNSNQLTQGTTFTVNMSVPKAGTYILQLRDCSNGVVATSIPFNAVQSSVPPEFNISTSYVNLTTETIYSGDVITGIWGVDNTNYSSFPIYYELQNYSTGTILRIPLTGQKGTISQITTGYDLIHLMLVTGLIPAGLNKVSLRADTGNSGTELAYENFTFSTLTASGYDVSVDKSCVAPGNPVNIHAIVPSGLASSVVIFQTSNTGSFGQNTYHISNTTTLTFIPHAVDEYSVSVIDTNDDIQKATYFTSTRVSCINGVPGLTPTPIPTSMQASKTASDLGGLLQNNMFWALVFIVGIALLVSYRSQKGK
jgi:hypothetical protein